jgi:hypothetical protein
MDEGEIDVINRYLKTQDLYLGLFTAPPVGSMTEDKTLADLTEVAEESAGYERKLIDKDDWTTVGSTTEQPYKQFDIATEVIVLGYFITDVVSGVGGNLISVYYFDSPITIGVGEYIKIKAKVTVS